MKNWSLINKVSEVIGNVFDMFRGVPSGNRPRTPQFGRTHNRFVRHKPMIPNGKWVMKYHRSRR